MTAQLIDYSALDALPEGTRYTILTPNQRIARRLTVALGRRAGEQGHPVWQPPTILAMPTFIETLWNEAAIAGVPSVDDWRMATELQLSFLWRSAIADGPRFPSLVQQRRLISLAAEAHARLDLHLVPDGELTTETVEAETFLKWKARVDEALEEQRWVTPAQAARVLLRTIAGGEIPVPSHLFLFAFDDMPPLHAALIQRLRDRGATVQELGTHAPVDRARTVAVPEREAQYALAARWAREQLREAPDATIGIICPSLADDRETIIAAFQRVFEPDALLPSTPRRTPGFNVSMGTPLSEVPIVRAAIRALSLPASDTVPAAELAQLVRSPFLGGAEAELEARAGLATRLDGWLDAPVDAVTLVVAADTTPDLRSRAESYLGTVRNTPGRQLPSQWARHFMACLDTLGWPGERPIDSEEYQAVQALQALMAETTGLDALAGPTTRSGALALFSQAAHARVFQPQTKDSPVQILGALEGAGLHFDRLWVVDFNDDLFPPAASPNPLLSSGLQRNYGFPHACAARELDYCRQLAERFAASADTVIFSHAQWDGDRELRPSRLLQGLERLSLGEVLPDDQPIEELLRGRVEPDSFPLGAAPVGADEVARVRGGTGLLKAQAACPFQAFARFRLRAEPLPEPALGLTHIERGQLMHLALDQLWSELRSSRRLRALSDPARGEAIERAIAHAFQWLALREERMGPRLRRLETARMRAIIEDWLAIEAERPDFKVESLETELRVTLAGLPLRLKRDRVDTLASGERMVLDYKTGRARVGDWTGERPPEPQMPLYVIADDTPVDAVAYGTLRADGSGISGAGSRDGLAEGVKTPATLGARAGFEADWGAQVDAWRGALEGLAGNFMGGDSRVDPVAHDTCSRCHLANLCRVRRGPGSAGRRT